MALTVGADDSSHETPVVALDLLVYLLVKALVQVLLVTLAFYAVQHLVHALPTESSALQRNVASKISAEFTYSS